MVANKRSKTDAARLLPSVDKVLRTSSGQQLIDQYGHDATTNAVREILAHARKSGTPVGSEEEITNAARKELSARNAPRLRTVFNLTGTVLHTNLGRALLAEAAIDAATQAMRQAVALEFDVEQGKRGERDNLVRDLLCELTGAEDATLVNNNAAAVLLTLNTLAKGKGAVVSRGELIEIGGAFRMPEIMRRAGTKLVEIGTTNRTHLRDYDEALNDKTGLILKVHTSNYRINGFTAQVPAKELAQLAQKHDVPLVDDLGSGTLIDLAQFGLPHEPTVGEAVSAGADLVTFSGDKLLGGPQAGFIVGKKELIRKLNKNPMKRALRVDKLRLAAIEATLRLYRNPEKLTALLPTYRHLGRSAQDIRAQADRVLPQVAASLGETIKVAVVPCSSQVGSGAMPEQTMPSFALALSPVSGSGKALERLAQSLRDLPVPVIGHISEGQLLLDLRCLDDEDAFVSNLNAFNPGAA